MLLAERDNDVLVVTLNRPRQLNALNGELLRALTDTWAEAADPDIRAVVVTGAGRGFCAGADLSSGRTGGSPATSGLRHTYNPHILAMTSLQKPVIAAVNGPAAGAGLALAFGADLRIASRAAKFVPAFARIGLVPDSGASYLVPRLIGYARSFEWFAGGRPVPADEALDWGLVNELVDPDQLMPRALELAHTLAQVPGRAVGLTKLALTQGTRRHLLEQLELEAELQEIAVNAPGRAAARSRVVEGLSARDQ
ncbi:enoyl-CoA hydratase-related protein [Kribbella hippodromi]|uniref:Enoyl-CoA hydratase-related protein n=1 Tax=Kribbella hippodromi TaxID=434347 RepID=A0ABN2E5D1_9ACTN